MEIKPTYIDGEPICSKECLNQPGCDRFSGQYCILGIMQQRDEYKAMFDKTVDFLMETEKTLSIQSTREQWTEFFRRKAARGINGYLEGAERKDE